MQLITQFYSRSYDAVIRVYDAAGNVTATRTNTRAISKSGSAFVPPNPLYFQSTPSA
jgi:hypothetical protein